MGDAWMAAVRIRGGAFTVVLAVTVGSLTAPAFAEDGFPFEVAEPRADWAWEKDERFDELIEQLAITEASIDAIDIALARKARSSRSRESSARRFAANNRLMDRKGGGPMNWREFYGTNAEKFFYHPVDPNSTYNTNTVLQQAGKSEDDKFGSGVPSRQSLPVHQRPPQWDYIYRANQSARDQALADAATLQAEIDVLQIRREILEEQQAELWGRLAFRAVRRHDIPRKPALRFTVVAAGSDAAGLERAEVFTAATAFMSAALQVVQKADENQAVAFVSAKSHVVDAWYDLDDALIGRHELSEEANDIKEPLGQFMALSKMLSDKARTLTESHEASDDRAAISDPIRRDRYRGMLQRALVDYAQILLALDELIDLLKDEWRLTLNVTEKRVVPAVNWRDVASNETQRSEMAAKDFSNVSSSRVERVRGGPRSLEKADRESDARRRLAIARMPKVITNSVGMGFVLVPPGTFMMGALEEDATSQPHQVTLTKPYYLGVTEVTNDQWRFVMGTEPPSGDKEGPRPVENVSWREAVRFCETLASLPSERGNERIYRLPTEAEWEYACRAGTTTRFYFGDDPSQLPNFGWSNANSGNRSKPVGLKQPNALGLYDMHGNEYEWCLDWLGNYPKNPVVDPRGSEDSKIRCVRGGAWSLSPYECRASIRGHSGVDGRNIIIGFRVLLEAPEIVIR